MDPTKQKSVEKILSPYFVRLRFDFSEFHDFNRPSLKEAARAIVDMLDDFRESGYDHGPHITSIKIGDHRSGVCREVALTELYRISGKDLQLTICPPTVMEAV